MRSLHLRRWLVAIVMIVGVAAGQGRSGPWASAPATGDPRSASIAASASGWSDTRGIMPIQPRIAAAPAYERGVRVKLPVLVGAVAAASLAAVVALRNGFRQQRNSRLPLALRARSHHRRAPPPLLLG